MKTKTLPAHRIIVNVDENSIQLQEKKIQLIAQECGSISGELVFTGYELGEFNVAILNHFQCTNEFDVKQLIKQATMTAWELGYDLFLSNKTDSLFKDCGFESFRSNNREIYCAELTWNAFEKMNVQSISSFINSQN